MKRFLVLCGALLVSGVLVGCNSDTHEDLIKDTIKLMSIATVDVGNIKGRIDDAIKRANETDKKLDLSEAVEATKKLKETGDEAQRLKRRIEQVRSQISDRDRENYAASQKGQISSAVSDLVKKQTELRTALADAEKYKDGRYKLAVKDLREKIVEAAAIRAAVALSMVAKEE